MIVAERKPVADILAMLAPFKKVLVLGCGGCVTICQTGGEREAEVLGSLVRLKDKEDGTDRSVTVATVERQCECEFLDALGPQLDGVDAVLSLACGVGVQALTERFPQVTALPAMNTSFLGMPVKQGVWEERCGGCGQCVLDKTGGICPVIRCAKSILNGPCGGSQDGMCEVDKDTPCAWHLIYDRLKALGRLEVLTEMETVKDWRTARDGGPRTMVREDMQL